MAQREEHYEGLAVRGHQLVWLELHGDKMSTRPLSPEEAAFVEATRAAALAEQRSWYRVVDSVTL